MEEVLTMDKLRRMFYLVSPNETLYSTVEKVPRMSDQALPIFFCFVIIELLACWVTDNLDYYEMSDSFTSIHVGLLNKCIKVSFRSVEFELYCYIYDNYRFCDLNWNSYYIWLLSFVLVDLGYYWFHRACHGLYQVWIHTEIIRTLGPLDYIFTTPSNHRVHHGKNPYCVNKNYGGTLQIWDHLFGTFEPERNSERPVYGLVFPLESFDQIWAQIFMFTKCFYCKPKSVNGWANKIKAVIFVPSWFPGLKYKKYEEVVPKIHYPVAKYKIALPGWIYIYTSIHFVVAAMGYFAMAENNKVLPVKEMILYDLFVVCTLQSFGFFYDNRWWAKLFELLRCILAYTCVIERWSQNFFPYAPKYALYTVFGASITFWMANFLNCYRYKVKNHCPESGENDFVSDEDKKEG